MAKASPTRAALLRERRRLDRVTASAALLRRKREALVRELLAIAAPAVESRTELSQLSRRAYTALHRALSFEGDSGLDGIAWPFDDFVVDMDTRVLWGQPVTRIVRSPPIRRSSDDRMTPSGTTGAAVAPAAEAFENLVSVLLETASRENLARRLGEALTRASRQVRTLEMVVQPRLQDRVRQISMSLSERELEEHLRLRRFGRRSRSGNPKVSPTDSR